MWNGTSLRVKVMAELERIRELVKEAILLVDGNPFENYLMRNLIAVECEIERQIANAERVT
jgi:hypothetical protein